MATLIEVLDSVNGLIADWTGYQDDFRNWLAGTETGGPNGDGTYPLRNASDQVTFFPSPAKLAATLGGGGGGGGTTTNITNTLAGVSFTFDTATADAAPAAGKIRFNNASAAATTFLYVATTDSNSFDITSWLDSIDDSTHTPNKSKIIVRTGATNLAIFTVTGAVVTGTGYRKIPVTYLVGGGTFANNATVAMIDIPIGDTGAAGVAGVAGATPFTTHTFSTTITAADPGNGFIRFNNATVASVTAIYIDNLNDSLIDMSGWYDTWDDSTNLTLRGTLHIRQVTDPTKFCTFNVTGAVVDSTGYRTVTVAGGVGVLPVNAMQVAISFTRTGDKGAAGSGGGTTNVYGATLANTKYLRKALGRVITGKANCRVVVVGDSHDMGRGVGSGADFTAGARIVSWPVQFARSIPGRIGKSDLPVRVSSFIGDAGQSLTAASVPLYDPRLAISGYTSGGGKIAGGYPWSSANTSSSIIFSPGEFIDRADIWAIDTGTGSTYSWNIGAGATNIVLPGVGGSGAMTKTTISFTRGSAVSLTIKPVSGTNFIAGIECYDSTQPSVLINNLGVRTWGVGADAGTYAWMDLGTGQAWRPRTMLKTMAHDVAIIKLGTNDFRTGGLGTTLPTFIANLTTMINELRSPAGTRTADVILVTPPPMGATAAGTVLMSDVATAIIALGASLGCVVVDAYARYGTYDTHWQMDTPDELHFNAGWHGDMAMAVSAFLASL